jgi:hypothetical protein
MAHQLMQHGNAPSNQLSARRPGPVTDDLCAQTAPTRRAHYVIITIFLVPQRPEERREDDVSRVFVLLSQTPLSR